MIFLRVVPENHFITVYEFLKSAVLLKLYAETIIKRFVKSYHWFTYSC